MVNLDIENNQATERQKAFETKGLFKPGRVHAAVLQSILLDLSENVRSVTIGANEEYFWLDIDSGVPLAELKELFPHIEQQFKERIRKGVEIDYLEMTRSNAMELARYLKQTYLKDEITPFENNCLIPVCRLGLWAGIADPFNPIESFQSKEPFHLGLQIHDFGKITDSKRHVFRIYAALLSDQKAKKEWQKTSIFSLHPGHFALGEEKSYWAPFLDYILWKEQGLQAQESLEKLIGEGLKKEKIERIEIDSEIEPKEKHLLLSQIKSFYTLDYETSPVQGCDLLPSILNRGFCKTLSGWIGANEKEVISLGISFLQIMESIHTIVRVKNFETVVQASGRFLPIAKTVPELKNSLEPISSKDSFLRVSCAWRDQWGRRWEVSAFDTQNLKSHRTSFEFLCTLMFRIDWILAMQLEEEGE